MISPQLFRRSQCKATDTRRICSRESIVDLGGAAPGPRLFIGLQKQIIGDSVVEKLYASAPDDQKHIQQSLSANCFGDHLTRSGIDVPTRELLTFSMLVSLGGCDPQVKGHVAANLHVGNSRAKLIDVLTQLLPFIGYPRTLNGLRAVDEITLPDSKKS